MADARISAEKDHLKALLPWQSIFYRPPPGWFVLDIMRKETRKWNWAALMVDVEPTNLKYCHCDFPTILYVDPAEYDPAERRTRSANSGRERPALAV